MAKKRRTSQRRYGAFSTKREYLAALAEGERAYKARQKKKAKQYKAAGRRLQAWRKAQPPQRIRAIAKKAARTRARQALSPTVIKERYAHGKSARAKLAKDWQGFEDFDILAEDSVRHFPDAAGWSYAIRLATLDEDEEETGKQFWISVPFRDSLDAARIEARSMLEDMLYGNPKYKGTLEPLELALLHSF